VTATKRGSNHHVKILDRSNDLEAAVGKILRDHEADGHLLDYAHTRNGAHMLQAALGYLAVGEPLPAVVGEWLTGAIQRVLRASDSVDVAGALELLPGKGVGRRKSHLTRETTRLMLEAIAREIGQKARLRKRICDGAKLAPSAAARAAEPDKAIAARIGKRWGRTAAWRTYCAWQAVNRTP